MGNPEQSPSRPRGKTGHLGTKVKASLPLALKPVSLEERTPHPAPRGQFWDQASGGRFREQGEKAKLHSRCLVSCHVRCCPWGGRGQRKVALLPAVVLQ